MEVEDTVAKTSISFYERIEQWKKKIKFVFEIDIDAEYAFLIQDDVGHSIFFSVDEETKSLFLSARFEDLNPDREDLELMMRKNFFLKGSSGGCFAIDPSDGRPCWQIRWPFFLQGTIDDFLELLDLFDAGLKGFHQDILDNRRQLKLNEVTDPDLTFIRA